MNNLNDDNALVTYSKSYIEQKYFEKEAVYGFVGGLCLVFALILSVVI